MSAAVYVSSEEIPAFEDLFPRKQAEPGFKVIVPPTAIYHRALLHVRVTRADELPKTDTFGKCDAYVRVRHAGDEAVASSSVVKDTFSPTWNQELLLPLTLPSISDSLYLEVLDWDLGAKDTLIGTHELSLSYLRKKRIPNQWVNLYITSGPKSRFPIYRGRVLVEVFLERVKTLPEDKAKPSSKDMIPIVEPPMASYLLRFDVLMGVEFQSKVLSDLMVEVSVGKHRQTSKNRAVTNGAVSWMEQFPQLEVELPAQPLSCPDILVSVWNVQAKLMKSLLGFLRLPMDDGRNRARHTASWRALISEDGGAAEAPGHLLVSIACGKKKFLTGPRATLPSLAMKQYELRAFIYQAKELPEVDESGHCDPYVVVRLGSKQAQTTRKKSTTSPAWFEMLTILVDLPEQLTMAPDIQILLFDYDLVGSDELVGRTTVSCREAAVGSPSKPSWRKIQFRGLEAGHVLSAFQLLQPESRKSLPPKSIVPFSRECVVEVAALGIRDVKAVKDSSVSSPFCVFEMGEAFSEEVCRKEMKTVGPVNNFSFLDVVRIPVSLATNPLFLAPLTVRAGDQRIMSTSLLGLASIDIVPFLPTALKQAETGFLPPPPMEPSLFSTLANSILPKSKRRNVDASPLRPVSGTYANGSTYSTYSAPDPLFAESPSLFDSNNNVRQAARTGSIFNSNRLAAGTSVNFDGLLLSSRRDTHASGARLSTNSTKGDRSKEPLLDPAATLSVENSPRLSVVRWSTEPPQTSPVSEIDARDGGASTVYNSLILPSGSTTSPPPSSSGNQLKLEHLPRIYGRPVQDSSLDDDLYEDYLFLDYPLFAPNTRKLIASSGGQDSQRPQVGVFMGAIRVVESTGGVQEPWADLFKPQQLKLRLYVFHATDLAAHDMNGLSDPYVTMSLACTGQTITDRENVQPETLQPDFYSSYEFDASVPGCGNLRIDVMDMDPDGDELIGSAVLDVENRWQCKKWRELNPKPIETLTLRHPTASSPQGRILVSLELLTPEDAVKFPAYKLQRPPAAQFELRVVIWDAEDVPVRSAKTGTSAAISARLEGLDSQRTDVHRNCITGRASFNWRMKWTLSVPYRHPPRIVLTLEDDDNPKAGGLAEGSVDVRNLFNSARHYSKAIALHHQSIPLKTGDASRPEVTVTASFFLLSTEDAAEFAAGVGRAEPNGHPFLPQPNRHSLAQLTKLQLAESLKLHKWQVVMFLLVLITTGAIFASLSFL